MYRPSELIDGSYDTLVACAPLDATEIRLVSGPLPPVGGAHAAITATGTTSRIQHQFRLIFDFPSAAPRSVSARFDSAAS
jgi:hypothetical protein